MTMSNPFEDQDAQFSVLINHEGQYSLWPQFAPIPDGWSEVLRAGRQECMDYVEQNWTDMRPRSLAQAMDARDDA
jgi:MbtH protein